MTPFTEGEHFGADVTFEVLPALPGKLTPDGRPATHVVVRVSRASVTETVTRRAVFATTSAAAAERKAQELAQKRAARMPRRRGSR